ncbi:MAG: SMC-Scp complex subunit ScpB [Solirubrobacteraceae bacterium]|nr:SMC-Scp complex subunit ScpB [Solirubrobacteraceae bacterium]
MSPLARALEALLFLSAEPVALADLAEAAEAPEEEVAAALAELGAASAPGERGIVLRELAGGWTLASAPEHDEAARRLLARPRTPPLTAAQAETLAIVAYLQPVSRPEITRIRGVSADSASATLLERGLIEEAGRSQFGAVLYRTTALFLKLFGLRALDELPDPGQWDPTPEEEGELRERLLKAGEARLGGVSAPAQPAFPAGPSTLDEEGPADGAGAGDAADAGAEPAADAQPVAGAGDAVGTPVEVAAGAADPGLAAVDVAAAGNAVVVPAATPAPPEQIVAVGAIRPAHAV